VSESDHRGSAVHLEKEYPMSDHTDLTTHSPAGQEPDSSAPDAGEPGSAPQPAAAAVPTRLTVPISELAAHPGNVREDLELTPEFCASIASAGVRVPLLITLTSEGAYRVIEGHRRLAAAVKTGLAEVPCDLDPGRAGDEAGQYLDMLLANSDAYRRNFAPVEEAAALFAAHEAGASRTRLRKATGRKAEEIKTALKAGQLSPQTHTAAGDLARELDLESLALLAEFDDDPGAVSQILDACRRGYPVEYVAERIRRDRAETAEHQRMVDELRGAGFEITDEVPPGWGAAVAAAARRGRPHPREPRRLPGAGRVLPALEPDPAGALLHQSSGTRPHPDQSGHQAAARRCGGCR
jgi:ParB-like chromosome segregation protein Spo0J